MSLNLYEILCPDGFVKNGYDKSKLAKIFANSMNNSKEKNTNFSHIDDSDSDKMCIWEFQKLGTNSTFEIYKNENCSPKHLSPETIDYLQAYAQIGDKIQIVLISDNVDDLSEEESLILKSISDNIIYKNKNII